MPDMSEGEFTLLCQSIQKIGQKVPIILLDGKILDGRSRYGACLKIGIQPEIRNYDPERDGPSPTDFVIAHNVNRRHLTTGQRAIIIQSALKFYEEEAKERKLASLKNSEHQKKMAEAKGKASEMAAAAAGVSHKSVETANKLVEEHPDLAKRVASGELSLNEAKTIAEERKNDTPTTSERDDIAKENFEVLKKALGEDFAISVRDGVNLKPQDELEAFLTLSVEEQKSIRELIARKWKVAAALKWINKEVDREAQLKDLFLRTLSAGGKKGTWTVDGWNVTVSRAK